MGVLISAIPCGAGGKQLYNPKQKTMLRKVRILSVLLLLCVTASANNLSLGSTVKILEVSSAEATFEISLKWDNAWRDSYNNDAAWIFLKYRTERSGWSPVLLQDNAEVGTGYSILSGKSGGATTGFFVYVASSFSGRASTTVRVKWTYPSSVSAEEIRSNKVFIMAQGIEMVYVPYGGYTLGDGSSSGSFVDADGKSVEIKNDEDLDIFSKDGGAVYLYQPYPNAYNGYYMMKYELSQEQYVAFINTLTPTEQLKLLPQLSTLKKGQYLFGASGKPSRRNGVIVSQAWTAAKAAVLDNNLDGNESYGGEADGRTVACNYMSVNDLLGYASWAGLRPMAETEYEKSCRRLSPQNVTAGEYAWGTTMLNGMPGLQSDTEGRREENPAGGNVNAAGTFTVFPGDGPVRCGAFASIAVNREMAGAGFSGVMEMSGNVTELCVNAGATRFDGSIHGSGVFSTETWGGQMSANNFGLRGGGFSSVKERLRVSDREEAARYPSVTLRDSTVGFRLVRMLDKNQLTVSAGEIQGMGGSLTFCSGEPFTIHNIKDGGVENLSGVTVSYEWYLNGTLLPDVQGKSLTYPAGLENFKYSDQEYRFTRRALCAVGEATTASVTVVIPGRLQLGGGEGVKLSCGTSTAVTASRVHAARFRWYNASDRKIVQDWSLASPSSSYTPSHAGFGYMGATKTLRCISDMGGCIDSTDVQLTIEPSCGVTLSPATIAITSATAAGTATATLCGAGTIQWFYKDKGGVEHLVGTGASYTPKYSDFNNVLGANTVVCRTTTGSETGCSDSKELLVNASATLDPGTITTPRTIACSGSSVTLGNSRSAGVAGMDGLTITYRWYVDGNTTPIEGETGATLSYTFRDKNTGATNREYTFTRRAFCNTPSLESGLTPAAVMNVPNELQVQNKVTLTCTSEPELTANRSMAGTIKWQEGSTVYQTTPNVSASKFQFTIARFGNTNASKNIRCISTTNEGNCESYVDVALTVSAPGNVSLSSALLSLSGAGATGASTATCAGHTFTWTWGSKSSTGATFTPNYAYFDYNTDHTQKTVTCTARLGSCTSTAQLKVNEGIMRCDGGGYTGVVVDGLCWMDKNLEIVPKTGYSIVKSPYGRVYDWVAAQTVCPTGWRLPVSSEWEKWIATYGASVGYKMKSKTGWEDQIGGPGDNSVGFNGLPGSFGYNSTDYGIYYGGHWFTSEISGGTTLVGRNIGYCSGGQIDCIENKLLRIDTYGSNPCMTVRCVRNY